MDIKYEHERQVRTEKVSNKATEESCSFPQTSAKNPNVLVLAQ